MIAKHNTTTQNVTEAKEGSRREYMRDYMKKRRNVTNFLVNICDLSESERYFFEERAAIMEFDGGMCRENAEIEAAKLTSIFFNKTKLFIGE